LNAYFGRNAEILDLPYTTEGKNKNILVPKRMSLHSTAKKNWELFHNDIDKLSVTQNYYSIRSTASKIPEQVLRIAGNLSLFENPEPLPFPPKTWKWRLNYQNFI
jgi:hypothetical protein